MFDVQPSFMLLLLLLLLSLSFMQRSVWNQSANRRGHASSYLRLQVEPQRSSDDRSYLHREARIRVKDGVRDYILAEVPWGTC